MCADAATANQMTKQDRPRTRTRKELTAYWVNLALNHSGKSPRELAAALKGEPVNRLSEGERIKYERYADVNSDGSMDFLNLKRFVRDARKLDLLPQRSGRQHASEDLLESKDPERLIDDSKRLLKRFESKKAALIKALVEYSECFKSNNSFSDHIVLDTTSDLIIPGNEIESDYVPEVHEKDLAKLIQWVEGHAIFSSNPLS